jgi:hypothetical protein
MNANFAYLMNLASQLPEAQKIMYANKFMRHDNKTVTMVNGEWFIDGVKPVKMMCEALDNAVAGYYGVELSQ